VKKNNYPLSIEIKKPIQVLALVVAILSIGANLGIGLWTYSLSFTEGYYAGWSEYIPSVLYFVTPLIMFLVPFFVYKSKYGNLQRGFIASLWFFIGTAIISLSWYPFTFIPLFSQLASNFAGLIIQPAILIIYTAAVIFWKTKLE
jgi:hypothetical protein